jgi:hypothetical protein
MNLTFMQSRVVFSCGATHFVSLSSQDFPSQNSEVYGTNCAVEELESSDKSLRYHASQREKYLRDEEEAALLR